MVTHNFTVDGTGTPTYTNTSGAVTATYYNGDTWADENGVLAEIDNTGTDDTVNVVIADGVWTATNIFYIGLFAAQDDGEVEIFNIELPYGWTSVEQDGGSAGFEPGGGEESFYFYHAIYNESGERVGTTLPDQFQEYNITNRAAPCFTQGTMIQCADGEERLVETLRAGDLVLTRDKGLQPIRWIGETFVDRDVLEQFPDRRPVRIAAGTFGNDRVTLVSPQHRMLVTDRAVTKHYDGDEVLVPAKALIDGTRISVASDLTDVSYYHMLFDRHEVVCGDGAWSESFKPGKWIMDSMAKATQDEVIALFPQLEVNPEGYSAPARELVRPGQLRRKMRGDVTVRGLTDTMTRACA